jgi:hypothetical protein
MTGSAIRSTKPYLLQLSDTPIRKYGAGANLAETQSGPVTGPAWAGERPWLLIMAAITAVELLWWAAAWKLGIAPIAHAGTYLFLAGGGLVSAALIRRATGLPFSAAPWPAVLAGTLLIAVGGSAFLPLKYAIPHEVPFWLDRPLALAERSFFGADPWLLLDHLLGWAAVPVDWLYGCWLPVQMLVLFLLVLARPSPAKSHALIAYVLTWFLLGTVAAMLLSSAGPIFYDRVYGGGMFSTLGSTLRGRGTWIAIGESDRMWSAMMVKDPGLIAGISAVPSIHVAVSLWIYLAARKLMRRAAPLALFYFLLVWIGSVQLGWHYASDGLAGSIGMLIIWRATQWFGTPRLTALQPQPLKRNKRSGSET